MLPLVEYICSILCPIWICSFWVHSIPILIGISIISSFVFPRYDNEFYEQKGFVFGKKMNVLVSAPFLCHLHPYVVFKFHEKLTWL